LGSPVWLRAAVENSDNDKSDKAQTAETKSDDADKKESAGAQEASAGKSAESEDKLKKSDEKAAVSKKKSRKSDEAKSEEKGKDKSETYTVKKSPFKVDLKLEGVFESKRNTEISIHPKEWSDWIVESAVEQGTAVKNGDTLIQFDTTKIDDQIRDEEAERKLAELSLDQLAAEIRLKEQSIPLELQAAERARRFAGIDWDQFESKDKDLTRREEDFSVKMSDNSLEYAQEQLRQLEKMYKGDDIAKETEEIVLKRTRDEVEMAEFYSELAKIGREKMLAIELPRREERLKENVDRTTAELQKARTTLPIELDKQRLELEKKKFEREKAAEKLARLQHDRDLMKVTASVDGLVYYGQSSYGKWPQGESILAKLRKGGHVSADEVAITVVDPNSLFVRATVPEKHLWQLRRGLTGSAIPDGYNDLRLAASLDQFSLVPAPGDKYLAKVLVDVERLPKDLPAPSPGMNCSVRLTAYSSDSSLTLPAKAIQTDKQNDQQRYVWLVGGGGKSTRHNITLGQKTDETVEITEGLAAGDKVFREPPKDDE
jgi:multidrug efflux pump subunit AcrA (membrane-fusion protein)